MIVFYKQNSVPLDITVSPKVNDIVYTDDGDCYKCIRSETEALRFEKLHDSVLNSGEYLNDLTKLQLELFWKLSKTELEKLNKDEIKYSV